MWKPKWKPSGNPPPPGEKKMKEEEEDWREEKVSFLLFIAKR